MIPKCSMIDVAVPPSGLMQNWNDQHRNLRGLYQSGNPEVWTGAPLCLSMNYKGNTKKDVRPGLKSRAMWVWILISRLILKVWQEEWWRLFQKFPLKLFSPGVLELYAETNALCLSEFLSNDIRDNLGSIIHCCALSLFILRVQQHPCPFTS